ncbi:RNA polymerase sigma factor [Chitinophagaceae bacterium LWZ2-11]
MKKEILHSETTMMTDELLVEMIQQNKVEAFGLIYVKYKPTMLKLASGYLKDKSTCEEIIQELFTVLYQRSCYLSVKGSLSSYLYTSLHNKILNHLRDQSTYKKHTFLAGAAPDNLLYHNDVETFVFYQDTQKKLQNALNTMPERYKEVYVLNRQDALTIKEISQILKRPIDTVEKQLRKAVSILRLYFREMN